MTQKIGKIAFLAQKKTEQIALIEQFLKSRGCDLDLMVGSISTMDRLIRNPYDLYIIAIQTCADLELAKKVHDLDNTNKIIAVIDDLSLTLEKMVRVCGVTYILSGPVNIQILKDLFNVQK